MKRKLLWFLFLANLVGAFYGFAFFYGQRILSTLATPWLLVFLPDCPLFALLAGISLGLLLLNRKNDFLFFLSSAGAMKYGFWTVFVLTAFSSYYFSQNALLYSILLVAHVALFLEAFLLFRKTEFKPWHLGLVLPFLLLNEVADYFFGTRPPMPEQAVNLMFYVTMAASVAFTLLAVLLSRKIK